MICKQCRMERVMEGYDICNRCYRHNHLIETRARQRNPKEKKKR